MTLVGRNCCSEVEDGVGGATEVPWYSGGGGGREGGWEGGGGGGGWAGAGGDSALGDSVLSTDELLLQLSADDSSDTTSSSLRRRRYSADDDDDDDDVMRDVTPHVTRGGGEFQRADVAGYFHSLRSRCQRHSGGKFDANPRSYGRLHGFMRHMFLQWSVRPPLRAFLVVVQRDNWERYIY